MFSSHLVKGEKTFPLTFLHLTKAPTEVGAFFADSHQLLLFRAVAFALRGFDTSFRHFRFMGGRSCF